MKKKIYYTANSTNIYTWQSILREKLVQNFQVIISMLKSSINDKSLFTCQDLSLGTQKFIFISLAEADDNTNPCTV